MGRRLKSQCGSRSLTRRHSRCRLARHDKSAPNRRSVIGSRYAFVARPIRLNGPAQQAAGSAHKCVSAAHSWLPAHTIVSAIIQAQTGDSKVRGPGMNRVILRRAVLSLATVALLNIVPAGAFAASFTEQGATILGGANLTARSVSLADIDNDGDLDMFFQGSGTTTSTSNRQMFRNNSIGTGSFTFTNVTSTWLSGLGGVGDSWSAGWADYNGDGLVDVFVGQTNSSGTSGDVLRNNGGSFSNETASTGLNDPGFHQNVGWADIDNDRDLDLVIGMEGPELHEIYLQGAGSQFTPVGDAVGIQVAFGTKGYGLAIGDTDGDGDLDMYISTCRSGGNIRNNFFKNMLVETGSLGFVDIADTNGTQNYEQHLRHGVSRSRQRRRSRPLRDRRRRPRQQNLPQRRQQFVHRRRYHHRSHALEHQWHRSQRQQGRRLRQRRRPRPLLSRQPVGDRQPEALSQRRELELHRCDGRARAQYGSGRRPVGAGGYDSAWGDLDRDGDQDLIDPNNSTFSGNPTPERVYVNDASTNGNHWLYVELAGPSYNTTGLGASLFATVNEGTPARSHAPPRGQHQHRHFQPE